MGMDVATGREGTKHGLRISTDGLSQPSSSEGALPLTDGRIERQLSKYVSRGMRWQFAHSSRDN